MPARRTKKGKVICSKKKKGKEKEEAGDQIIIENSDNRNLIRVTCR